MEYVGIKKLRLDAENDDSRALVVRLRGCSSGTLIIMTLTVVPRTPSIHSSPRNLISNLDRLELARVVQSLGDVYRMREEYAKAGKSYTQARNISSDIRYQSEFPTRREVWETCIRRERSTTKPRNPTFRSRTSTPKPGYQLTNRGIVTDFGSVRPIG